MKRDTITKDKVDTICWFDNTIVDWGSAGMQYLFNGSKKQLGHDSYQYKFNAAIVSPNEQYVLIYERLGTKALLLKNGEDLREINRSYYCAEAYEYPAAFFELEGVTYLIHCPFKYCRLDFENAETGEIITDIPGRSPQDFFYSRLEVNSSNTYFISKGWVWHPLDITVAFNIADCITNPLLLDDSDLRPDTSYEVCTASFINDTDILIGTSDEPIDEEIVDGTAKHFAIWNLLTEKISTPVKVKADFGNLFVINENFAWDTFKYPKIINIKTGEIADKNETIDSGHQQSSIFYNVETNPQIILNKQTKQLAIKTKDGVEILTPFV